MTSLNKYFKHLPTLPPKAMRKYLKQMKEMENNYSSVEAWFDVLVSLEDSFGEDCEELSRIGFIDKVGFVDQTNKKPWHTISLDLSKTIPDKYPWITKDMILESRKRNKELVPLIKENWRKE